MLKEVLRASSGSIVGMRSKSSMQNKITFLLSSLRAGGGERVMVMLANQLVTQGRDVEMLVLKQVGEYDSHVDSRVHITNLDAWRMIFAMPKIVVHMRKMRPAVAIATDEYTHLLLLAAKYISKVDTKIVLRIGNVFSELYARYTDLKHALRLRLIKKFYTYADVIIANSQGVADDICELTSMSPSRVKVIFNPKPLDEIQEMGKKPTGNAWFDAKDMPVVVGVGRLREQKNFPLLIRAFSKVVKDIPCRLALVGGGRDEQALRSLAHEVGVEDSVLFAGYQDNPFAFMAKADVYVLPSLWEGMPNSLMEAMVCGVPVIASDCKSGPRELLAPDSNHAKRLETGIERASFGMLTAVNDEEALVDALRAMLGSVELQTHYANASLERAKDFDSVRITEAYINAIGLATHLHS